MKYLETDSTKLSQRVYNMQAISFTPGELTEAIQKLIPEFSVCAVHVRTEPLFIVCMITDGIQP